MNNQLNHYISIEPDFFQELEGEFGIKITGKLAIFLRTVEIVRPNRFMTSEMKWCGVGRKKLDRVAVWDFSDGISFQALEQVIQQIAETRASGS